MVPLRCRHCAQDLHCRGCGAEIRRGDFELMLDEAHDSEGLRHWNALAQKFGLRKIRSFDAGRRKKLLARLKELPNFWAQIEAELPLLGRWAREKRIITIDFVLKPANLNKLLEGTYRDETTDPPTYPAPDPEEERQAMERWADVF